MYLILLLCINIHFQGYYLLLKYEKKSKKKIKITILFNISYIKEYDFLNCYNLECIIYYETNYQEIYDNSFSGNKQLSFIITYLIFSSETFGSYKV